MKFKDARKLGRKIIIEERCQWVYLYQTKDKEWWISDCENFQSTNWYYLHKDGRILDHSLYDKWRHSAHVSAGIYPFSKMIPRNLYNKKGNLTDV